MSLTSVSSPQSLSLKAEVNLQTIPSDVLDCIAFYVVATPEHTTGPPAGIIPLLLTCRQLNYSLSSTARPNLYSQIFRHQFDTAALLRRYPSSSLTASLLTQELKIRWKSLKRLRKAALSSAEKKTVPSDRNSEVVAVGSGGRVGGEGVTTGNLRMWVEVDEEMKTDLWMAFLMCLENDGRNLYHLVHYCHLPTYLPTFLSTYLYPSTSPPNYPPNTTDRSLALWIDWFLTSEQSVKNEEKRESAERMFILRPYVFAAQKFDAFYAPWTFSTLPLASSSAPAHPELAHHPSFLADLSLHSRGERVCHFGQQLTIAAPLTSHSAMLEFFARIDSESPLIIGPGLANNLNVPPHPIPMTTSSSSQYSSTDEVSSKKARTYPERKSETFDLDYERMISCHNPQDRSSRGLGTKRLRGMFEGVWEGNFTFLDFESYRDMLSGQARATYEGQYGVQPKIWRLHETIVRYPVSSCSSPPSSMLNAGFPPDYPRSSIDDDLLALTGVQGCQLISPSSTEEEGVADESGEEVILLTGSGHSAWGEFSLKGRVRGWDGLVSIVKEYSSGHAQRGRWLYRGYVLNEDTIVGRWRDTFTPEHLSGYEGCFHMIRRS